MLLTILKYLLIIFAVIILAFVVLLLMPNSKLRKKLFKAYYFVSFIIAIISAIYIVSPIDAVPDIIPVAGQSDDLIAAISALATAISGYVAWQKSKEKIS